MQSIGSRRTATAFRAYPARLRTAQLPQSQLLQRRTYAEGAPESKKPPASSGSLLPILAVGGFVVGLFSIYFTSSNKDPGSGQAEIKEKRREKGGAHGEYHDARDSGVKTLEQKKAKQEKEQSGH